MRISQQLLRSLLRDRFHIVKVENAKYRTVPRIAVANSLVRYVGHGVDIVIERLYPPPP